MKAPTALAEKSDLANGPLRVGPAAWNGRDLGRIGRGTRGDTVWAAPQLGHGSHRVEPFHLGQVIRRRGVRDPLVVAYLRWAVDPGSEERAIPAHQNPLHIVQNRDNDLPARAPASKRDVMRPRACQSICNVRQRLPRP